MGRNGQATSNLFKNKGITVARYKIRHITKLPLFVFDLHKDPFL